GADLLRVYVERSDDLDVADVISAQVNVHQPGHTLVRVRVFVVLESLHERRGAVAHTHDRQTDLAHEARSFLRSAAVRRFVPPPAVVPSLRWRSASIRPSSHAMSDSVALRPCSISASV